MKRLNLLQGSPEWHEHRRTHKNASDAPAMMGVSPHTTRSELLHRVKFGLLEDPDRFQQRRYDEGHEFERLARPLGEKIVGEPLYPIVGEDGDLSASFDGLTMADDTAFEHKRLNEELRAIFGAIASLPQEQHGAQLPIYHQIQMEQQLRLSGAERVLFMATEWDENGNLIEAVHCWYYPNLELRAKIDAGWAQFDKDLATYVPEAKAERVVADVVERLPMVFDLRVEGKLVACNIDKFKPAALAYISKISTNLSTDQEFANATEAAKYCRESADKLELAIEQALGQMGDINAAIQAVREVAEAFDAKGLSLEKLVDKRKSEIKLEIHQEFTKKLADHVAELNTALGKPYMPPVLGDWAKVMKGLRTVESLRENCNNELAQRKIVADEVFRRIQSNLNALREKAADYKFLFEDTAQLVQKPCDDVLTLIDARVTSHKAAEEKRLQAERDRIRAEEQAKAEKEVRERQEDEDRLIAGFDREAKRIEHDSTPYIQKAIATYESTAKDWENDPRPQVREAYLAGRTYLKGRLEAAAAREQEAAQRTQQQQTAQAPAPAPSASPAPAPQAAAANSPTVVPITRGAPAAPAVDASADDEWQPADTLPKAPDRWIEVQEIVVYRWLPYKAASAEARRGIKGRWQRHNGHGFDNCEPPSGPWRIDEEKSAVA